MGLVRPLGLVVVAEQLQALPTSKRDKWPDGQAGVAGGSHFFS